MSAITGIFYRDGRSVDSRMIKKINDRLAHRGPDGSSTWCEGPVAFGHQMLFTTPESLHEELPFFDDDSGLVITADARVDNREKLSKLLELEDIEKISDSLFILQAYQKWGEKCSEHLLGDFAFAIWDPDKERMFCARDHMGVKPFYYYLSDDLFLFASEIKAINGILSVEPRINELAIAKCLAIVHDDREITFFSNVYRLPGGHNLSLDCKGHKIEEYWNLDPECELPDRSDDEYKKIFYDVFSEAVRCRLRSTFPLGFTLSGGLDSSSVLCTARNIFKGEESIPIHTYSLIFDNVPEVDESFYINTVLEDIEYNKHFIRGDNLSPLFEIKKMFWHLDSPHIGPNAFLNWKLYENVQKDGVRILLTGFDGDTVLSKPYMYQTELFLNLQFKKLHNEMICLSKRFGNNYTYYLKNYVLTGLVPDIYRNIRKPKLIINKDFAIEHDINKYDSYANNVWKKRKNLKNYHYHQITSGLIQKSLEDWDARSAAFSIETRHPFFDKRMVELCYALPPEQKLKNGWDRVIMRRAMENILPYKIQWRRTKSNLSENFIKSLLFYEKDTLTNIICEDTHNLDKYVQIEELKKAYSKFKAQGTNSYRIWVTTTLALWLKYKENHDGENKTSLTHE